jgi:LysM repeat protein
MLSATTAEPKFGATRQTTVQVVVRRRQVLSVLVVAAVGCALLAAAGLAALWWLAGLFTALAVGYLSLVARLRHLRVRRQMDLAFGSDVQGADEFDWHALEQELHLALAGDEVAAAATARPPVEVGNRAIGRFLVCWALGWVLTPIVTVIRVMRRDLSVLERQGIANRIVRWQQYGRSQSLRLLTVGAAASVGITAVGGLAGAGASPMPAAVSTTTQSAAAPSGASTYTVVAGDTLSAIAARSATTVGALAGANHLANPNLIFPGEVLSVAGGVSSAGASAGGAANYLVRGGDTLSSIARSHGTTVAAIVAANSLANPNLIFPGQALQVPVGATPSSATATGAPAGGHYVVRAGDDLAAVARRYRTTVAALAATNHLANPNLIFPGQVLTVPAAVAGQTASAVPTIHAPATSPAKVAAATPVATTPDATTPAAAAATVAPVATTPVAAAPAPTPAPAPAPVAKAPAPAPAPAAVQAALPLPLQYLHGGSVDQGVDYSAPGGTPLYAMGPGKIIRAGMTGFGPNCPVLEITGGPLAGKTVYYGHAGANLVPVGATVAAGQQISVVGYGIVGYSTGPHLEIGFYPPGGNGSGGAMLNYINGAVGHSTAR